MAMNKSMTSLPLLPDSLWSEVVVPVRVPFMVQIKLLNHFLYLKPFKCEQTNDWYSIEEAIYYMTERDLFLI